MQKIETFESYQAAYQLSVEEPETFWAQIAGSFQWKKPWENVLDWNFELAKVKWFEGGELNITENCIDRHLPNRANQTAIIWEPNDPQEKARTITYAELHRLVMRFANVLLANGINKGDRVCIYMPMVPEAAVAMLACARIGAIHSVVFAGFSAQSLSDRMNDAGCKMLITADGFMRGNKKVLLKEIADTAMATSPTVEKCIVYKHRNWEIAMQTPRDLWWQQQMETAATENTAVTVDSEHPLFILYTSGSTGKPKGLLHTTAGYMIYTAYTFLQVFQYKEGQVHCCTADIGWITGHSYIVYGPLLNGATTMMFEGIPNYPDPGRFWDLIDKHGVNTFYTAPTAIRSLEVYGTGPFEGKSLDTLKVLGSVGEPINEEAWHWYSSNVGKDRCPLVDTWWQTETGGIMISALAGVTSSKPAFATLPLPGIQALLVDANGEEIEGNEVEGNLCIKYPWPGMARTVYGDHERFVQTYFSTYKGYYFTGDGARRDADGDYRITGRVDDVINVSGHRIGTGEVEDALDEHPLVVESAVVGYPHDIKGQALYAFIICTQKNINEQLLCSELNALVTTKIGSFAKPDKLQIVEGLPKTRSGKIMRRILRKIACGEADQLGDTSTLLDPTVVDSILSGVK